MAKHKIFKKDGTPTPYFWSDKDKTEQTLKTVYKQATDGIKRMRGVQFEPGANRMHKA